MSVSEEDQKQRPRPLREKLVTFYELIFQGKDPSANNTNFWDEFFLLKTNVEYIQNAISRLSTKELLGLKASINRLSIQCCRTLQSDENMIRNINALQTLCSLVQAVFKKQISSDTSTEVVDILVGLDSAECQMRNLVESLNKFLTEDYPLSVKNLSLKLVLIILTAVDNVSQNVMLEYLMMNSLFEAMVQILSHPDATEHHGYDTGVCLSMLVNYRKHEAANPYVIKLSVLNNEIALNGLGSVVAVILNEYIKQYAPSIDEPSGIIGTVTSWFGSMLAPPTPAPITVRVSEAVLLVLYEAVHLNKHFLTVLTHTRSASTPTTPTSPAPAVQRNLPVPGSPSAAEERSLVAAQPNNLLGTFLTFTSIILQSTTNEKSVSNARLCLIILTCVTEDPYTASFLHDPNMTFRVDLHRAPLLHRKMKINKTLHTLPLACSLLELLVEFTVSHLSTKHFQIVLYHKVIGVIHRTLCYQKRNKVRLAYHWKDLWRGLINLLKFLVSSGDNLLTQFNVFLLVKEVIKVFNLFITYGDTFLPSPTAYDELYYEIIRERVMFDKLYQLALKHSNGNSEYSSAASQVSSTLFNIRSIPTHFVPKIDAWSTANQVASLSPVQVLEVVRSNYDTLTLKLQDGLDQYDKYTEKPTETAFFTQLVRSVTGEVRQTLSVSSLQQTTVLTELAGVS